MLRFFLFLSIFISISSYASTLILDNDDNQHSFTISYLNDKTSKLSIESIQQQLFVDKSSNSYTLGYLKGTLWIRLDVFNKSDAKEFIISVNETFYEKANLYHYDDGWKVQKNSLFLAVKNREVKHNKLSFNALIPKDTKKTFYIKLEAKYAYFGKVTIDKKDLFYFEHTFDINNAYFFGLGTVFLVFIFNLILYFSIKEKIFFYYIGYSFFNFIYILNISGILVYLGLQNFIYELHLSSAFMLGFLMLFSIEYLETKKYLPRLNKFLYYSSFVFFMLGILVAFSYQPWNKVINNFAGLYNVVLIISALVIYFREKTNIKYYIIAIGSYFIFVVIFTAMVAGLLEYNNLTRYGFVFASVLESILFALILIDRYTQKEKQYKKELKKEISDATKDLKLTNKKLHILIDERELLLKEVLHRVKNNFHLVSSILWLEMQNNKEQKDIFTHLINRITSMSMIHDYLYKSENISNIDLQEYLQKIISSIEQTHITSCITLVFNMKNLSLHIDDTVSLGIIINEVITNSLKHNSDKKDLKINIILKQNIDKIKLLIEDNGVGYDINKNNKGLGLKLIEQFSKKFKDSHFSFTSQFGAEFNLIFTLR